MGHKKLIRFEAINNFKNVLQKPLDIKSNWHKFFNNKNPITLELACGKGEYTIGLAKLYKDRNFIGIDIKGNRIYIGAKSALDNNLGNVAFLRIQIDHIEEYFSPNEVQEIWITFPDPFLRISKEKKRLTHWKFLQRYQNILSADGKIHLKTDSPVLYEFTLQTIQQTNCKLISAIDDVNSLSKKSAELEIKTYYQSLDIAESKKIFYVCFQLPTEKILCETL